MEDNERGEGEEVRLSENTSRSERARRSELQSASEGAGPLLQRDYWAVIQACPHSPQEVMTRVRDAFTDFPPDQLVTFHRMGDTQDPLSEGDKMEVNIRMMKPVTVSVTHVAATSLTLGTGTGHPEAGRITFGAYRNERDDVIFHIRSRARPGSSTDHAGFLTMGDPMQTHTWTDFIDALAHRVGGGVIGAIYVEEQRVDEIEDDQSLDAPTFIARED
jgi:hypothetical protein